MKVYTEVRNNRIYLTNEQIDKERCRSIPGARWDKNARQWHVPLSWAACKQLRTTFNNRLEIGPDLYAWATQEVSERIGPSLFLRDTMGLEEGHPVLVKLREMDLA